MRAVSDDVTGQILNHGVGYVSWKIAQDTSASDASRRNIIEEFLRYVPILVAPNAFKGDLSARDVAVSFPRADTGWAPARTDRQYGIESIGRWRMAAGKVRRACTPNLAQTASRR